MNYATPHAFNVGYNNEQKHGHTVKGGAVAVSLVMSKRENNTNPGGSVHERGVSCYIALQEIVMYMRLRGDPAASKIVMCFASTGICVLPS